MSGLHSSIPIRGLNPYGSDALGGQVSMRITAVNTIGRQIALGVRGPGEINGAGGGIGYGY
jgi:hypothetical protein